MNEVVTPRIRRAATWFMTIAVVLAMTTAMVVYWQFAPLELGLFRIINNLPDFLHPVFELFTALGSELVLIPILGVLWWRRRYAIGMNLIIASGGAYVVTKILKALIDRPRVFNVLTDVHQRAAEASFAFPSGHTTFASAIALYIALEFGGRWRWVAAVWIGLVALSRMYLGVHTPLDILAGLCVGAMAAIFVQVYLPLLRKNMLALFKHKH